MKALIRDEWYSFLFLWAVTPMFFFSLAGNILWTYVLPGLPAFSILVADLLDPETSLSGIGKRKWLLVPAGLATPVVFAAIVLLMAPAEGVKISQKDVVRGFLKARPSQASRLVYIAKRPFSAEFYSGGRALEATTAQEFQPFLHGGANFFVIEKGTLLELPGWFKAGVVKVGDYGRYELLGEKPYMHSMAPVACHPLS